LHTLQVKTVYASCQDWYEAGQRTNDYYTISNGGTPVKTFCLMDTNGGG